MISQADLEADLWSILDGVRRIRPSDMRNPHAFHEDKGAVAGQLLALIERVRGPQSAQARSGLTGQRMQTEAQKRSTRRIW